ncbi:DUF3408 domain-containing protein [Parabacteroides sp. Marseille-P3160]|uniref:DUF3408 domain-containing protein n=1 Tax=Parabacteroides sp. Marseille-P3160 TaxID=1917887 RepID=UPI0009BBE6D6|nr:DUF3408 domain-containing protein [Parabacteroides sp. Marseille-P3160]
MAKKVDTSGFDPDFIIGQTKPDNRANPQVIQPAEPALEDSPPEQPKEKETPKRKRGGQAGYKETFLKRNEIKTRQCVYISFDVHAVITKLVRALVDAGNDISVGGYIDTVLNEHLQLHKEEINEVYRQRPDDLL